jgi:hypothetical protein
MGKKKAAWTVMVYLAGDNNLTTECLFALMEMKKAMPGEHINVLAQFDPRDEHLPTHRYLINRNGPNTTLYDDIIDKASFDPNSGEVRFQTESKNAISLAKSRKHNRKNLDRVLRRSTSLSGLPFEPEPISDDTDTGSPVTLYNFLSFCIQEYRAEHYMAVLSGHAGGTESDYLLKDESSKGSLTFNEMKQVFQELKSDLRGQPIDIVGMDNCLMSMGEICYEFRGLAQIVVGCESYSPASGWPYRQIIERLRQDFTNGSSKKSELQVEAAKAIVEEYVNYYSPYWVSGMSVTQSALDVRRVVNLREHVDRLALTLDSELKKRLRDYEDSRVPFKDELVLAHWEAQSFNGESFVDLFDFCDCLEKRTSVEDVSKRCQAVKRFLAKEFVLRSCYSGAAYQYSYGVSLYFPWSEVSSRYENLDFVKDSAGRGWLQFLQTYTDLTRRRPRGFDALLQASIAYQTEQSGGSKMSDLRMSDLRMSDLRMSDLRMSDLRMSDLRMSDLRMSDLRMSDLRMSDLRMSDLRMSDLRMSDLRMSDLRMMASEGKNPIHSMRNPPIVFFPTECIAEDKEVIKGLRQFFLPPTSDGRGRK